MAKDCGQMDPLREMWGLTQWGGVCVCMCVSVGIMNTVVVRKYLITTTEHKQSTQ